MKLKGIDRSKNKTELYNKRDRSFKAEQAKVAKAEREESRRLQNGKNKFL